MHGRDRAGNVGLPLPALPITTLLQPWAMTGIGTYLPLTGTRQMPGLAKTGRKLSNPAHSHQ